MVDVPDVQEFLAQKEDPDMWRMKASPKHSTKTDVPHEEKCPECGSVYEKCDIELVGGTIYGDYVCPSGHEYTIREPPTYQGTFL